MVYREEFYVLVDIYTTMFWFVNGDCGKLTMYVLDLVLQMLCSRLFSKLILCIVHLVPFVANPNHIVDVIFCQRNGYKQNGN
jgi:hypothetical protein